MHAMAHAQAATTIKQKFACAKPTFNKLFFPLKFMIQNFVNNQNTFFVLNRHTNDTY